MYEYACTQNCDTSLLYVTQVMSKCCSCKFLYGSDTSTEETEKLEEALENRVEISVKLNLYKKHGQSSRLQLFHAW